MDICEYFSIRNLSDNKSSALKLCITVKTNSQPTRSRCRKSADQSIVVVTPTKIHSPGTDDFVGCGQNANY
jgi:hypothetical protein